MSESARSASEEARVLFYLAVGIAVVHGGALPRTPSPLPVFASGLEPEGRGERGGGGELQRGGTWENLKKTKPAPKFDPASIPVPAELQAPEFLDAWKDRLAERAESGSRGKQTPTQVACQLKKLAKLARARGIGAAIFCLERATEAHHQGVVFAEDFEERSRASRQGIGFQAKLAPGSTSAQLARAAEIDEQEAPSIWGRS